MSAHLRPGDVAPDDLDAPFWEACLRREFLVQRCLRCGRAYWPASCCTEHGAEAMRWEAASGTGTVHTYTVVHHVYEPGMAERVPYALAVIQLDEGPFFHSDLVECPPEAVHVGMRVEVVFDAVDAQTVIPRFRPAASTTRRSS
jgi:hypothetical protein